MESGMGCSNRNDGRNYVIMLHKIKAFIEQNHMLAYQDRVVIGLSGGADSVCLFFVLLMLKEEYDLFLAAVHVNHGIRGREAQEDQAYAQRLCRENGIPCEVVKVSVPDMVKWGKLSPEEAGRNARYGAFEKTCEIYSCNKIAVAHNRNDQSETVLIHLFRGSGLRGLGGIAPVRGKIIRPLLDTDRTDIIRFLEERNIAYQTDSTNLTEEYTRNRVRNRILPLAVETVNERAPEHIAKTAVLLREADEYIEKNAISIFSRIVECKNGKYFIRADGFLAEETIIKKRILLMALEKTAGSRKDIDSTHIEMALRLFQLDVGKRIMLPYGIKGVREYDGVTLFPRCRQGEEDKEKEEGLRIPVAIPGKYFLAEQKVWIYFYIINQSYKKFRNIPKNNYTKWFDYDKIKNTVFLRNRQPGDYLEIDGQGRKKKIKDYFIDSKIPREERKKIPLMADGSHVIWVIGQRISEAYKINENTKRILTVVVEKDKEDM